MGGEAEAAGDALTGAIIAHTIDSRPAVANAGGGGACRNCGAALVGAYCAACGQAAHIHRSLRSLGHDILHGVFHFEGKFWRTMPELLLRPGRLTRRYIEGERAKFVSPMALFLFTVFAMFAVFSFSPGATTGPRDLPDTVIAEWQSGNQSALDNTVRRLEVLRAERARAGISPERRATLDQQITELESARQVMETLAGSGVSSAWQGVESRSKDGERSNPQFNLNFNSGWVALDRRLNEGARAAQQNPGLLFYKLKTNSYKFSWMLIPLSLPFLWLLFFWRRDVHLYDHAIFATYSISFMMMLMIVLAILDSLNVGEFVWGLTLAIAPTHMYKQLRGAYGLSRAGAFVRLVLLLISASIVLTIFFLMLLAIGVLT